MLKESIKEGQQKIIGNHVRCFCIVSIQARSDSVFGIVGKEEVKCAHICSIF